MKLFKYFPKPPKLELHALEPDETWYSRAYWLTMLAKELKSEVEKLRAENYQLLHQVNSGEPITIDQAVFLSMRGELDEALQTKAKLEKRLKRSAQVNQGLIDEVEDLRNGIDRAA